MFGHKSDIGGNWAVLWPSIFATRYFSFAATFYTRQFHMVKGIINAFDHLELCLVINLTLVVTGLYYGHQYLLLGILVLQLPFIPGSKYLLPTKKNSITILTK